MTLMTKEMAVAIRLRAMENYIDSLIERCKTASADERLDLLGELMGAIHARREMEGHAV